MRKKGQEVIIKFLLDQTIPKLNKELKDLDDRIYFVKNGKKKRTYFFENKFFKEVKIYDFEKHKYDFQKKSDSISFNNFEYIGFLICSKGLIPQFISLEK